MANLEHKYRQLQQNLSDLGSVLLAFSGGVDSTLLLKVCQDTIPGRFLAVTANSETSPRHELQDAVRYTEELGARHLIIESEELSLPAFVENPTNKCYICKKLRFSALGSLAKQEGLAYVIDGSNLDDSQDYRPGMQAIRELGVRSPLMETGFSKSEVRQLSRNLGLSTWNKPPYACLASRIPYGSPITREKLRQVDAGEEFLRNLGLSQQIRVRHYGDTARIEVTATDLEKFLGDEVRARIVSYFKELGFCFVTLDLEGYRMGSLNRAIQGGSRRE
jgi:uncharacterized protein